MTSPRLALAHFRKRLLSEIEMHALPLRVIAGFNVVTVVLIAGRVAFGFLLDAGRFVLRGFGGVGL